MGAKPGSLKVLASKYLPVVQPFISGSQLLALLIEV